MPLFRLLEEKRSGSAFAVQTRWPDTKVKLNGAYNIWHRVADSGHRATYKFCPVCGSTLTYIIEGWEGITAVPVGAFADQSFSTPRFSVYENRKHGWVDILGDDVKHSSTPSSKRMPGQNIHKN